MHDCCERLWLTGTARLHPLGQTADGMARGGYVGLPPRRSAVGGGGWRGLWQACKTPPPLRPPTTSAALPPASRPNIRRSSEHGSMYLTNDGQISIYNIDARSAWTTVWHGGTRDLVDRTTRTRAQGASDVSASNGQKSFRPTISMRGLPTAPGDAEAQGTSSAEKRKTGLTEPQTCLHTKACHGGAQRLHSSSRR